LVSSSIIKTATHITPQNAMIEYQCRKAVVRGDGVSLNGALEHKHGFDAEN
jgi:hypothetical protein